MPDCGGGQRGQWRNQDLPNSQSLGRFCPPYDYELVKNQDLESGARNFPLAAALPLPRLRGGSGRGKPLARCLWPGPLPSPPPQAGEGTLCDKRKGRILHALRRVGQPVAEAVLHELLEVAWPKGI